MLDAYSESGQDLALVTLPASSSEFGNVYLDPECVFRNWLKNQSKSRRIMFLQNVHSPLRNFSLLENNGQSIVVLFSL